MIPKPNHPVPTKSSHSIRCERFIKILTITLLPPTLTHQTTSPLEIEDFVSRSNEADRGILCEIIQLQQRLAQRDKEYQKLEKRIKKPKRSNTSSSSQTFSQSDFRQICDIAEAALQKVSELKQQLNGRSDQYRLYKSDPLATRREMVYDSVKGKPRFRSVRAKKTNNPRKLPKETRDNQFTVDKFIQFLDSEGRRTKAETDPCRLCKTKYHYKRITTPSKRYSSVLYCSNQK